MFAKKGQKRPKNGSSVEQALVIGYSSERRNMHIIEIRMKNSNF
jgi:hypothetical protein